MLLRSKLGLFIFVSASIAAQPAMAQQAILTDAQIEYISDNCQVSKVALNRVHTNDVVLRVNLGQRYETIARRLMAPMNSRIATNSLDNVELTKTTVDFNQAYSDFTEEYRRYDDSVTKALQLDCKTEPIDYYRQIERARDARKEVAETVDRLQALAKQYDKQINEFGKQFEKADTP